MLVILTFGSKFFLRLGVKNSYVSGLVLVRLGASNFLRLAVSSLTFGG